MVRFYHLKKWEGSFFSGISNVFGILFIASKLKLCFAALDAFSLRAVPATIMKESFDQCGRCNLERFDAN